MTSLRWSTKRLIVALNVTEAVLALVWLLAAYRLALLLVVAQQAASEGMLATRSGLFGIAITLNMSLLILGAAAGAVGSIFRVFARSFGSEELEHLWWYLLLRPVYSANLGSVAVVAVNTGLTSIGHEITSRAGMVVLVLIGCLAGLLTDPVLRVVRGLMSERVDSAPSPAAEETAASPAKESAASPAKESAASPAERRFGAFSSPAMRRFGAVMFGDLEALDRLR